MEKKGDPISGILHYTIYCEVLNNIVWYSGSPFNFDYIVAI